MPISALFRAFHREALAQLADTGWRKRIPGLFTYRVSDTVLGWLGFPYASRAIPGCVLINPKVGIRHQEIERRVAELRGQPYHRHSPPTICGNIGYLMPEATYKEWLICSDSVSTETVREILQDIKDFGLPFIERHARLETLVDALLTSRLSIKAMARYTAPVGLLMLNRVDEAEHYLEAELQRISDEDNASADSFRQFVKTFRQ